jgi:hypothetical protein
VASVGAQSRVGHREEAVGVEQGAGGGDILIDRIDIDLPVETGGAVMVTVTLEIAAVRQA